MNKKLLTNICSIQGDSPNQETEKDDVRSYGSHPNNLETIEIWHFLLHSLSPFQLT